MAGRISKYEKCVKPYLETIKQKSREGVAEKDIAESLGICEATLNNYKNKYPELKEALSKDKGKDVLEALINAGIEAAKGGYKENEQTVYTMDENGNPVIEKVIVNKVWQPPNPALHKFYVLNYGKEQGLVNDPLEYELKLRKQEFDEALEKRKNWLMFNDKT